MQLFYKVQTADLRAPAHTRSDCVQPQLQRGSRCFYIHVWYDRSSSLKQHLLCSNTVQQTFSRFDCFYASTWNKGSTCGLTFTSGRKVREGSLGWMNIVANMLNILNTGLSTRASAPNAIIHLNHHTSVQQNVRKHVFQRRCKYVSTAEDFLHSSSSVVL